MLYNFLKLLLILITYLLDVYSYKPNFVIFQPDEMRAESIGCYQRSDENIFNHTPNFDNFANTDAVLFEQVHTSYTVCSQSRVAFMTGWPTHVRGHRSLWSLLHKWEPNLLKYFVENGYEVKWWGKNDLLSGDAWKESVSTSVSFGENNNGENMYNVCLLYTSPSPRDLSTSRMPSSA